MAIRIPDMNPLRFFDPNEEPDFYTKFPNGYNQQQRVDYYPGINATKFFRDHVINQQLSLQFGMYTPLNQVINVYKMDNNNVFQQVAVIQKTDITPDGYVSESIYRYNWTPSAEGVYYMEIPVEGVQSDILLVHNRLKYRKRLVEIQFFNTYNDFGMIFFNNETQVYTGKIYLEGNTRSGEPAAEISGYPSDRGSFIKTRATPVETLFVNLLKVHYDTYQKCLNKIFSCNRIKINGIYYQNEEGLSRNLISNSDLANYSLNLTELDVTYSKK